MDTHTVGSTLYLSHGKDPRILLVSGMHGDESESAALLQQWMETNYAEFLPFLYIPFVSPSAVRSGTRKNKHGHDINRHFLDGSDDTEVQDFISIVKDHTFDICIDLHEDPDRTKSFYIYDSEHMTADMLAAYRQRVLSVGASLYSGIDDAEDDTLGCMIDQGYYPFRPGWIDDPEHGEGFSSKWLVKHKVIRRQFTLENPGKAPTATKQTIIEQLIPFFATSFLGL